MKFYMYNSTMSPTIPHHFTAHLRARSNKYNISEVGVQVANNSRGGHFTIGLVGKQTGTPGTRLAAKTIHPFTIWHRHANQLQFSCGDLFEGKEGLGSSQGQENVSGDKRVKVYVKISI